MNSDNVSSGRGRTRRSALRGLAWAGGGAALAAGATLGISRAEADPKPDGRKTYVFVHGTNASAGYWTPYARELEFRGHRTIAVDQPYHGAKAHIPKSYLQQDLDKLATDPSPLGEIGLDDFAEAVEKNVRRAAAHGKVVLVGHSMGGVSLSRVGNAVPELISHICYMAAYCCSTAMPSINDCMAAPESGSAIIPADIMIGDPTKLGVNRYNFLGASDDDLELLRKMAWEGNSKESFLSSLISMQPDESARVAQDRAVGEADTWGSLPRTYLRFGKDNLITPQLQDRMIAEADKLTPDNRFTVHKFEAPHFGPEDAGDIVDVLEGLG